MFCLVIEGVTVSKIGRKPIDISGVQVSIDGQKISYKGSSDSGEHTLSENLTVEINGDSLVIEPRENLDKRLARSLNKDWGLHRALLANKIHGAKKPFSLEVQIHGLGYKAAQSGSGLTLSLGYSHKIEFPLPKNVSVNIDKTGQKLTFQSSDNVVLGGVVSRLKALRPTEPYKGTGIRRADDVVMRKDTK